MTSSLRKIYYIMTKDVKTHYFKPGNMMMGLMFPLVMIITFSLRDLQGLDKFMPGLIAMTVFFGASSMEQTTLQLSRKDKTIERLLMAPISFSTLLMGKMLGGAAFGLATTAILLPIALLAFNMPVANLSLLVAGMLVSAFTAASFGGLIAVAARELHEAMNMGNLIRFPMVFLSGVFIPVSQMNPWLQKLAYVFPLTYSVDVLRQAAFGTAELAHWGLSLTILLAFGILFLVLSAKAIHHRWLS